MSTLKSSAENLTLNADGSGNDIKFQSNGVEKASIDQDGSIFAGSKVRLIDDTASKVEFGDSGNASIGKIEYTHSGDYLYFKVNDAERLRITSGGDLDVKTGDIVFNTAGKGICLGVTTNTDSNTLDDYEEGTYEPTLTGATSGSFNTASYTHLAYTKIGRLVHIQGYLNIGSESSCVGSITMSLPFTCVSGLSGDSENAAMTVSLRSHGGSNLDNITGTVADTGMRFVSLDGSGSDNVLDASDVDTVWNIRIGGCYVAA